MARALVIYSKEGKGVERLAKAVGSGLEKAGVRTDVMEADPSGSRIVSAGPYDIVCVGSAVFGSFKVSVGGDIDSALKRVTRLEGKKAAAFVVPKLIGTAKGLKKLMGLLEHQGAIVSDFASPRSVQEAEDFGKRLEKII